MRRACFMAAAVVMLVANGMVLFAVRKNRSDAGGGRVELTERELRVVELPGESTVTLLEMVWDSPGSEGRRDRRPAWLGIEKLRELGFDCSVAPGSPEAHGHYAALAPRRAFLVLEHAGEAWTNEADRKPGGTRLFVVDAGRDARALKDRYGSTGRHLILRGVIRASPGEGGRAVGATNAEPRLGGWVAGFLPPQIGVPLPQSRTIRGLPARERVGNGRDPVPWKPRFAATIVSGARCEPWIEAVRVLDPE